MATEPSLYADKKPKSNEGSTFFDPKSAADSIEHSSLSGEQPDIRQEESYMVNFPDTMSPTTHYLLRLP